MKGRQLASAWFRPHHRRESMYNSPVSPPPADSIPSGWYNGTRDSTGNGKVDEIRHREERDGQTSVSSRHSVSPERTGFEG